MPRTIGTSQLDSIDNVNLRQIAFASLYAVFVTGNALKLKEVKAFLGEETNPKFVLVNQELDRKLRINYQLQLVSTSHTQLSC